MTCIGVWSSDRVELNMDAATIRWDGIQRTNCQLRHTLVPRSWKMLLQLEIEVWTSTRSTISWRIHWKYKRIRSVPFGRFVLPASFLDDWQFVLQKHRRFCQPSTNQYKRAKAYHRCKICLDCCLVCQPFASPHAKYRFIKSTTDAVKLVHRYPRSTEGKFRDSSMIIRQFIRKIAESRRNISPSNLGERRWEILF